MYDRQKFKSLVHYICWKYASDPTKLGAVKLNKAVWLSDLAAYYRLGRPITGARYVKREFGPVPKPILPVLRELEQDGAIRVQDVRHYGKQKTQYLVLREAPAIFLESREREIVDEIVRFVCEDHTAASISAASHDHIWKAAEDGEEIPHFTVFANQGRLTDDDREWARIQLEQEHVL